MPGFADIWITELQRFIKEIEASRAFIHETRFDLGPALNEAAIEISLRSLCVEVPGEIREFIARGASNLCFSYKLQVVESANCYWGGFDFDIAKLSILGKEKDEWMRETWISEDVQERPKWEATFPFCRLSNGDYLGVINEGEETGFVMYLSHDSQSQVVGRSFSSFLQEWAKCCYIGPELWVLGDFLSPDNGLVDGRTQAARLVRASLPFTRTNSM